MKRLITIFIAALCLGVFNSCETDYYEPVFGYDNLPTVIPAEGGTYTLKYAYEYYATKADVSYFEWECRVIIDGVVVDEKDIVAGSNMFTVVIPRNRDAYPKAVTVEASTHVLAGLDDYWGDWTPIASAVQQSGL